MKPSYVKHLVECNCILPQYLKYNPPVFHQFVVFSKFDEAGSFIPSFAQCNNCGAIHKVTEVFKSRAIAKENVSFLPKAEEIKTGLNPDLVELVDQYNPEIHTWQEIQFIVDNDLWGKTVLLSKEEVEGITTGKFLLILGKSLFKIDSFSTDGDNEDND
jgi:hypothetical protein